jgi:hypothetical protein
MSRHLHHYLTGTLSITSLIEALGSNSAVAVVTGVAAIVTSLWGAWRSNRKQDFELSMYETIVKAIVAARVEAINARRPDPFPGLMLPGFPSTIPTSHAEQGPDPQAAATAPGQPAS